MMQTFPLQKRLMSQPHIFFHRRLPLPFEMLSADQLRMAASDHEALQAAHTARPVLVQNLCKAITQNGKRHKEPLLVSSVVQRFFSELPLRLLVILLGRLLPLLRSTATLDTPLLLLQ